MRGTSRSGAAGGGRVRAAGEEDGPEGEAGGAPSGSAGIAGGGRRRPDLGRRDADAPAAGVAALPGGTVHGGASFGDTVPGVPAPAVPDHRGVVRGPRFDPAARYRRADLHLHSHFSYDVLNLAELSPRALYDKAAARGMDFFTLTDHETLKGVEALRRELEAEYGDRPPIPVIPGIEMKVRDPGIAHTVHVNVLGLDRRQMGQLARRRRSMEAFLDYCREQDLYHAYNHPFWFERGERPGLETVTRLIREFPVVELNAGRIPQLNRRTLELARRFGKQVVATSDSHTGQLGKAYTAAPGETPEEFLRNVRRGVSVAVPHHASLREFMGEIRETIDLVFVGQRAFRPKRTFLQQAPLARRIARAALGSEALMGPRPLKRGVKVAVSVMAWGPAWAFILQQRRMHSSLGDPATVSS